MIFLIFIIASCNKTTPDTVSENISSQHTEKRSGLLGDCAPEDLGVLCTTSIPVLETINLINIPGYPGCTFTVQLPVLFCQQTGASMNLYFGEFELIDHNCTQFDNNLLAAQAAGQVALNSFLGNFDLLIFAGIESHYTTLTGNLVPVCTSGQNVNISWHLAGCVSRCIKTTPKGNFVSRSRACGTGCCYRYTKVCIGPQGPETTTTTTTTTNPTDCDEIVDWGKTPCDFISLCSRRCN